MSDCWPIIHFTINGTSVAVQAPPMKRLLDVLRENLRQIGRASCRERV